MQNDTSCELHICFKRSYDSVLRHHHNFVIRSVVSVCFYDHPSKADISDCLTSLLGGNTCGALPCRLLRSHCTRRFEGQTRRGTFKVAPRFGQHCQSNSKVSRGWWIWTSLNLAIGFKSSASRVGIHSTLVSQPYGLLIYYDTELGVSNSLHDLAFYVSALYYYHNAFRLFQLVDVHFCFPYVSFAPVAIKVNTKKNPLVFLDQRWDRFQGVL